jgi:hypothetical protein
MSRIGVIVISYNTDPEPLFNSLRSSRHDIRSYVFLHGQDAAVRNKLEQITAAINALYFPYATNRGVARSWNEGLQASFSEGNDATFLINDDLFFYGSGFDAFADFVLSETRRVPEFGTISAFGLDMGTADSVGAGKFYQRPHWQGAACMAIGRKAIEGIGYFDQNFWPAYFEDADYFRRLDLMGIPNLWDERVLLEHNRSQTVRSDFLLQRLHEERVRRNERYYIRKWGGLRGWGGPDAPPGLELFKQPFNDPLIGCAIPLAAVEAPYGPQYDRCDLAEAAVAGVLTECVPEELLSLLNRRAQNAHRLLQWGVGDTTAILAGFARAQHAGLLLSIDHRREYLLEVVEQLPRYSFLHPRFIDAEELSGAGCDSDIAYVSYPALLGIRFDAILIGGRWRMECAMQARTLLTPRGIIIFQGWQDRRYEMLSKLFEVVQETRSFLVLRADSATAQLDGGARS